MKKPKIKIGLRTVYRGGQPRLVKTKKAALDTVELTLMGGKVKTSSGDVWKAKRVNNKNYQYVAIS